MDSFVPQTTAAYPFFVSGPSYSMETADPSCEAMLLALSSLLDEMCARNDCAQALSCTVRLTKFHSIARPGISIFDYLGRIRRYSCCSDACFIVALIYMDAAQNRSGLVVDSLNVHRLLITCIMVASKFFDDKCQRNSVYSQIGGLEVTELNQLEVELLNSLGFSLDVNPDQFKLYEGALVSRFLKEQAAPRFPLIALNHPMLLSSPSLSSLSSFADSRSLSPSSKSDIHRSPSYDLTESSQVSAATSPHYDSVFSSPASSFIREMQSASLENHPTVVSF